MKIITLLSLFITTYGLILPRPYVLVRYNSLTSLNSYEHMSDIDWNTGASYTSYANVTAIHDIKCTEISDNYIDYRLCTYSNIISNGISNGVNDTDLIQFNISGYVKHPENKFTYSLIEDLKKLMSTCDIVVEDASEFTIVILVITSFIRNNQCEYSRHNLGKVTKSIIYMLSIILKGAINTY